MITFKLVLNSFSFPGKKLFGQSKDQGVKCFGLVISFQQVILLYQGYFSCIVVSLWVWFLGFGGGRAGSITGLFLFNILLMSFLLLLL